MTDWQLKFAVAYWATQLRLNERIPELTIEEFEKHLTKVLTEKKPGGLGTCVRPQLILLLALKKTGLGEKDFPLSSIDMLFEPDGTIKIHDGSWRVEKAPTENAA